MKHSNTIFSGFIVFTVIFSSIGTTVHANTLEVRGTTTRGDGFEKRIDKIENRIDKREENKEIRKEQASERMFERLDRREDRVIKNFENFLSNIKRIATRIKNFIDTQSSKGRDTTKTSAGLTILNTKISLAETAIADFKSYASSTASTTDKNFIKNFNAKRKITHTAINEAYKALGSINFGVKNSATSTATTTVQ